MKRLILLLIMLLVLVTGCSAGTAAKGAEKLCRIELYAAQDGTQLAVLDDQKEIKALWDSEGWEPCKALPKDLTPEYQILVLQEKTLLYGQDPEEEREYEIITVLTTFRDSDYVQESILDNVVKNITLPEAALTFYYTMSDETLDILRGLAGSESL